MAPTSTLYNMMANGQGDKSVESPRPFKRRRLANAPQDDIFSPLGGVEFSGLVLHTEENLEDVSHESFSLCDEDNDNVLNYTSNNWATDDMLCDSLTFPILDNQCAIDQTVPEGWLNELFVTEAGPEKGNIGNDLDTEDYLIFGNAHDFADSAPLGGQNELNSQADNNSRVSYQAVNITKTVSRNGELGPYTMICFGMLSNVPILDFLPKVMEKLETDAVLVPDISDQEDQPIRLRYSQNSIIGRLDNAYSKMIRILLNEPSIEIQWKRATIVVENNVSVMHPIKNKNRHNTSMSPPSATTAFIIYGNLALKDKIGLFLAAYRVYLQRPTKCERNVPYINPQNMSCNDDVPQMTFNLNQFDPSARHTVSHATDPSQALVSVRVLTEAEDPVAIKTHLLSHQKQALSFMLRREQGWDMESDEDDIWKHVEINGNKLYCNSVTQSIQHHAPLQLRGGILADCMGLGKTLSTIALIASDNETFASSERQSVNRKPTLIVAPLALLATWVDQMSAHLHPKTLRWTIYRRPISKLDTDKVLGFDVVLTSYDTIAAQWRNNANEGRFLFSTMWHRIVLDEAHEIRNGNTSRARAICTLRSERRWVLTGTPIQNRVQDLAGLLTFLRVFPDENVTAMLADKSLLESLACLCLRRATATIDIPERSDKTQYVEFSAEEAERYSSINQSVIGMLESPTQLKVHINILAKINVMRQICNLGLLYQQKNDSHRNLNVKDKVNAQETFEDMLSAGDSTCVWCGADVIGEEEVLEDYAQGSGDESNGLLRLSECGQLTCANCVTEKASLEYTNFLYCKQHSSCLSHVVTLVSTGSPWRPSHLNHKLPSKMLCLQKDLLNIPVTDKSIIFSFWTSTLDTVEQALAGLRWNFSRVDGSMPNQQRQDAIARFRNDSSVRAILFSLRCGSTGLNLTEANHVFLMEPQWNPMVEDQAFARVHRLGQRKPVTTVRYIVKGTLEENIRNMQRNKRDLAQQAFATVRRSAAWIEVRCYNDDVLKVANTELAIAYSYAVGVQYIKT